MKQNDQLRALTDSDLDMILRWRNAPEIASVMYTQHEISMQEHLAWWEDVKGRQDQAHFVFEIDECPCGVANLKDIDLETGTCVFGLYAAPDAERGTGTRIMSKLCEYVFETLNLDILAGEALDWNQKAIALYRRFGFECRKEIERARPDGEASVAAIQFVLTRKRWKDGRNAPDRKACHEND